MQNQKKYILKGKISNPGWELRNKDVLVLKSSKEGKRKIQFVPGADSIYEFENKEQGKPKAQWFTNGTLLVDADDTIKILYMESHPDFNVKYELFDPEAKATEEFNLLELVEKARAKLRAVVEDENKLAATAAALFGVDALNWGPQAAKLRCYKYAESKPKETISALEDPATEAKYIAALGLKKGVVDTNPGKTAVVWNDKDRGVICVVAAGKKPLSVLGEFLYTEDELTTLQEISKRIEEIDGKPTKAKASKK